MRIEIEKASEDDIKTIRKQCGSPALDVYGVVVRCPNNYPQIVMLNPIVNQEDGEINYHALANLLWLSCPAMCRKIKELENQGMVQKIEKLLHKERPFVSAMTDAHAHFYYFRKEFYRLLTGHEYPHDLVRFFDTGIGGIRDVSNVKCLHMHFAHYKINQLNVIGKAVEGLIREQSYCGCEECQCRV